MKDRLLILIAVVLWGISLVFRIPYIQDVPPVNNVAHIFMLQTLDIWEEEGPLQSHFAMKHTFSNPGDKAITYYKRYEDADGNNYYVSHPSLVQIIAWMCSLGGVFHLNNSLLMIMAMLLHLAGVLFLQRIIRILFSKNKHRASAELLVVIVYLFHPLILYMNTFHFFAESLGQCMLIMMCYVFLNIINKYEKLNIKHYITLVFVSFLFSSAEWMGIFFSASVMIAGFLFRKKGSVYFRAAIAIATGSFLAVVVYLFQHISLQDADTFVRALGIRYLERSGFFGQQYTDMGYSYSNPESYLLLFRQIAELFTGIGLVFLLPFITIFTKKTFNSKSISYRILITALFLCCTMYLVVLFSATVTHYIYIAKWVVPLILIFAYAYIGIVQKINSFLVKLAGTGLLILLLVWSVFIFRQKASLLVNPDPELLILAQKIAAESHDDESVFYIPRENDPQTTIIWLSYMSHRNMAVVGSEQEICSYRANVPEEYVFYYFEDNSFLVRRGRCAKKGE
jgi:hypothetical protein